MPKKQFRPKPVDPRCSQRTSDREAWFESWHPRGRICKQYSDAKWDWKRNEQRLHELDRVNQLPRIMGHANSTLLAAAGKMRNATAMEWDIWGNTNNFERLGLMDRHDFETLQHPQPGHPELEQKRQDTLAAYLKVHDPLVKLVESLRIMEGEPHASTWRYFDGRPKGDVDYARFKHARRPYVNKARAALARALEQSVLDFGKAKVAARRAARKAELEDEEVLKLFDDARAKEAGFKGKLGEWQRENGKSYGSELDDASPIKREFPRKGIVEAGLMETSQEAEWKQLHRQFQEMLNPA